MSSSFINLFDLDLSEITKFLKDSQVEKFRAKQIWNWLYMQGRHNFDQMKNLPQSLRVLLKENCSIDPPALVNKLISTDGTQKLLLQGSDGKKFETVFIPEDARGTLCISSQIGCFVGCKFCHTGTQGFERNLNTSEIIGQILVAKNLLSDWPTNPHHRKITNLVFMGMGEPLFNYDNLCKAIKIITVPNGLGFSRHDVTVSTSGVVDKILNLAIDTGVNLALSLHSADHQKRSEIMPINKSYELDALLKVIKEYPGLSKTDYVTFEYLMLDGVNDSEKDAVQLIKAIKGISAKVNIIPFNTWSGCLFKSSSSAAIEKFAKIVSNAGYVCTIRRSRGQDIMAACGQLKTSFEQ